MATAIEEVVVDTDQIDVKYLPPNGVQSLLITIARTYARAMLL